MKPEKQIDELQKQLSVLLSKLDQAFVDLGWTREDMQFVFDTTAEQEKPIDVDRAIKSIEHFYPADSRYQLVAETGQRLLGQAIAEVYNWRGLPAPIILYYAKLCLEWRLKQRGPEGATDVEKPV